jgi:DNA (cytosine-5)-methyltransferase 1
MDKIVAEIRSDEGLRFFRGGCCGTLRTIDGCGDKVVIELEQVGQLEGSFESTGRVYSAEGLSPTLNTMGGGNREPKIIEPQVLTPKRTEYGKAVRKAYENGVHKESRHTMTELEPRSDGISNTLTTVQKDNYLIETHFRVRKLTPRECWRLMGFDDTDFDKAKLALNKTFYRGADRSNSQLYKQAGNSIVTNVLSAIFGEMIG